MSLTAALGLASYRVAGRLAGPFARRKLRQRVEQGKEDPLRLEERFGVASRPRPNAPLVWLHGASVGESLAGLLLIDAIRREHPSIRFLVTTGTMTSARLLSDRLPPGAVHQYVPLDLPGAVARFLQHWQPDLVLWLESEFWPNMLTALDRHGIPRVLVNGRVSSASHARWSSLRPVIAHLLGGFQYCLAQTEKDAEYLRDLGARNTMVVGSLKESAPPLPADGHTVEELAALLEGRVVWVAASTHAGEEEIAFAAHREVAASVPGLLTIVAPRHPERGAEIAELGRSLGLNVARRSGDEVPNRQCDVYVADTMGEMGIWYRLASVAFVGKSISGAGGQNPWEPASLDCAVLFGPRMANFQEIADGLLAAGAARCVHDEAELSQALVELLSDEQAGRTMREAASTFTAERSGSLAASMAVIEGLLADTVGPGKQEGSPDGRAA